jgi:hypothetical protein
MCHALLVKASRANARFTIFHNEGITDAMSSLTMTDRRLLERFLAMGTGYVLNFSDREFGEFVEEAAEVNIHSERYTLNGTSKANKLRTFWKIESDYLVGRLLLALIDYACSLNSRPSDDDNTAAAPFHARARNLNWNWQDIPSQLTVPNAQN